MTNVGNLRFWCKCTLFAHNSASISVFRSNMASFDFRTSVLVAKWLFSKKYWSVRIDQQELLGQPVLSVFLIRLLHRCSLDECGPAIRLSLTGVTRMHATGGKPSLWTGCKMKFRLMVRMRTETTLSKWLDLSLVLPAVFQLAACLRACRKLMKVVVVMLHSTSCSVCSGTSWRMHCVYIVCLAVVRFIVHCVRSWSICQMCDASVLWFFLVQCPFRYLDWYEWSRKFLSRCLQKKQHCYEASTKYVSVWTPLFCWDTVVI